MDYLATAAIYGPVLFKAQLAVLRVSTHAVQQTNLVANPLKLYEVARLNSCLHSLHRRKLEIFMIDVAHFVKAVRVERFADWLRI